MLQFVLYGIVTGVILILATVGFFMIRKIENFLNIAHSQMLLIGAYLTLFFNVGLHMNILISAVLSIILTALIGWLIAKVIFWPMAGQKPDLLLITSVGLAFIIEGIVELCAGVKVKGYDMPLSRTIRVGDVSLLSSTEFLIIAMAIVIIVILHLLLTRTTAGKAVRAMASNYDLAMIRRIDTRKMSRYVWLLSSGLAGLAGICLGLTGKLTPELGWNFILIILCVAVVGGLSSSVYGVMVSALILGVVMEASQMVVSSAYRELIAFALIILVLYFRPQGLFGGEKK